MFQNSRLMPLSDRSLFDGSLFRGSLKTCVVLAGLGGGIVPQADHVAAQGIANTAPPALKRTPATVHATAILATGRLKRVGESGPCDQATAVLVKTPPELEDLIPANSVLLLTAWHVVTNPSGKHSYEIDFFKDLNKGIPSGQPLLTLEARLLAYSGGLGLRDDLALLVARLPDEPAHREEIARRRVRISDRIEPIERYEPLTSVGFPAGSRDVHHHNLLALNVGEGLLTKMVLKGHSGAGVFNQHGELAGIVSGSHTHTDPQPDFPIPETDHIQVEGPKISDPTAKAEEARRQAAVLAAKTLEVVRRSVPQEVLQERGRTVISNVVAIKTILKTVGDECRHASSQFDAAVARQEDLWNRLITSTTSEETKAMLGGQLRLALTKEADVLFEPVGGIPPQLQERIRGLYQ